MKTVMTKVPCKLCPFRRDVPIYLRRDRRAEIALSLANGETFWCHSTVDYDAEYEDDEEGSTGDTTDSLECIGAAKALLLNGGSTQSMRIADRLGLVDLDAVEAAPVEVWSLSEWQRLAEGATRDDLAAEEEVETCSVVDTGCLAPAGFLGSGGGVVLGTEPADDECSECGEPVCSACLPESGICPNCEWNSFDFEVTT